jgi:hypothetical protein
MTATEHAREFFIRLALSDDGLGYPPRMAVVATDQENAAKIVWRAIDDEGMPIVIIDGGGKETLVAPLSRTERLVDRIRRRRARVRIEIRADGAAIGSRTLARAALERELLAG